MNTLHSGLGKQDQSSLQFAKSVLTLLAVQTNIQAENIEAAIQDIRDGKDTLSVVQSALIHVSKLDALSLFKAIYQSARETHASLGGDLPALTYITPHVSNREKLLEKSSTTTAESSAFRQSPVAKTLTSLQKDLLVSLEKSCIRSAAVCTFVLAAIGQIETELRTSAPNRTDKRFDEFNSLINTMRIESDCGNYSVAIAPCHLSVGFPEARNGAVASLYAFQNHIGDYFAGDLNSKDQFQAKTRSFIAAYGFSAQRIIKSTPDANVNIEARALAVMEQQGISVISTFDSASNKIGALSLANGNHVPLQGSTMNVYISIELTQRGELLLLTQEQSGTLSTYTLKNGDICLENPNVFSSWNEYLDYKEQK